jgi:hypothetical protein
VSGKARKFGDVVGMGAVEHLPRLDDPARLALAQIDERVAAGPVNSGEAQDVRFDPPRPDKASIWSTRSRNRAHYALPRRPYPRPAAAIVEDQQQFVVAHRLDQGVERGCLLEELYI